MGKKRQQLISRPVDKEMIRNLDNKIQDHVDAVDFVFDTYSVEELVDIVDYLTVDPIADHLCLEIYEHPWKK